MSEWLVFGEPPPNLGENTGEEGGEMLTDEMAEIADTALVLRDMEGVEIGDTSW